MTNPHFNHVQYVCCLPAVCVLFIRTVLTTFPRENKNRIRICSRNCEIQQGHVLDGMAAGQLAAVAIERMARKVPAL